MLQKHVHIVYKYVIVFVLYMQKIQDGGCQENLQCSNISSPNKDL